MTMRNPDQFNTYGTDRYRGIRASVVLFMNRRTWPTAASKPRSIDVQAA
jgi:hypothetical protein